MDNYALAAQNAKKRFLTYDQRAIAEQFHLLTDAGYLYVSLLGCAWRICRKTAAVQRKKAGLWQDAEDFYGIMVLFDLLCDARPDRFLTGIWKSTQEFGVHRSLLEDSADPQAHFFDREPEKFIRSCEALGGKPAPYGDLGYTIPLLDGLEILITLWHSDEDFGPRLRFYWDQNATMYLKYETMHYALSLLRQLLQEVSDELC